MITTITKIWLTEDKLYLQTENGWQVSTPFALWKGLRNATAEQRANYYLSYTGIHWPALDEDLGFENLFADAGFCPSTPSENSVVYCK